MPGKTNSLRDKLEDNQLDLSLSQLTEVPVQEIVSVFFGVLTILVYHRLFYILTMSFTSRALSAKLCRLVGHMQEV